MSTQLTPEDIALSQQQHSQLADAMDRIGLSKAQKIIILLVAIGTIFDAIEQFNIGYAAPAIQRVWHLQDLQVGLMSTATFGGVAAGCLLAGIAGDLWGRKVTYLYNLALYTLGALVCAFAPDFTVLVIGRILVGIGLGGELNTGVTIVSEMVPTKVRGACTAIVQVAGGGLGIFLSSALSWAILVPGGQLFGGDDVSWRWLLGVLAVPALLVFVYRRYMPESPRYLLTRGQVHEANTVLSLLSRSRLRNDGGPVHEFVKTPEGRTTLKESVRLLDIFRGALRRRTAVLWIVSFMAFGAQDTITIFMPSILVKEGYGVATSLGFTLVINAGGLIGSILGAFGAHQWRRKIVLGYGCLGAVVTAIGFVMSPNLGLVLLFGSLFQLMSMVLNTLIWVWAPEMYPTRVRAFGVGASVFIASMAGSIIPPFAGKVLESFGAFGIFGMVVAMYLIAAVAVKFGPETLGRSLEQISELDDTVEELEAVPATVTASPASTAVVQPRTAGPDTLRS
ncbi:MULTISPECIES: MFS transporter [Arthrobacter]|uniref:MFS transporter n=2 Tax=Arthrobacter TaxID=1663 RepID=A0ABU9KFL6_9MICC|nr:MFS transporter [Arthrobacter sp. YJM1]MDP5225669.1 MFS transporter [Arthrobacter sp. YJM1]